MEPPGCLDAVFGRGLIYPSWNKSSNLRAAESTGTLAIDRAAHLLTLLLAAERPRGLAELAAEAELPKSTASRLLGALERRGLIQQRGRRGQFGPGPVLLRYAHRGIVDRHLAELAQPHLNTLSAASDETINLAVPTPLGVEHVAQVESRHYLGTGQWIGRRVPYHCTAVGKVLLAFDGAGLPAAPLEPLTPATIVDPERLAAELAAVRRDGCATAVDELETGLASLAAPVFGDRARGARGPVDLGPDAAPGRGARGRAPPATDERGPGARCAAGRSRQGSASRMTHDELLQLLYEETLVGNAPAVTDGVEQGLADDLEPERMLYEALIPSLEEVGARFERGDYFVPEMLIAARAMQGALNILRPLLAETGTKPIGTFLMGTVKGDVHDIGKNLCNIMLEGAGFEVIDLGVNVPPERFVEQINEHEPDVVGFSAFLTTTMPMFKANINALQKAGIRDKVIVMVGGAPVTQEYADAVGADGYSADASSAVKKAKQLIEQRRQPVTV